MISPKWTLRDQRVAAKQGWGLFNVDTDPSIQRLDEEVEFESDEAVITFLRLNARSDCVAAKALALAGVAALSRSDASNAAGCVRDASRAIRAHGGIGAADYQSSVSDVLVSLMMFCAKRALSFDRALSTARRCFQAETTPDAQEFRSSSKPPQRPARGPVEFENPELGDEG